MWCCMVVVVGGSDGADGAAGRCCGCMGAMGRAVLMCGLRVFGVREWADGIELVVRFSLVLLVVAVACLVVFVRWLS